MESAVLLSFFGITLHLQLPSQVHIPTSARRHASNVVAEILNDSTDLKEKRVSQPFFVRFCGPALRNPKKFVVVKTLGAPEHVNLIPRVKTLNSPNEVDRTSLQDS